MGKARCGRESDGRIAAGDGKCPDRDRSPRRRERLSPVSADAGEVSGRFGGKVVPITGTAGGQGRAAALLFAAEGAQSPLGSLIE
jgi:hypothetical protein